MKHYARKPAALRNLPARHKSATGGRLRDDPFSGDPYRLATKRRERRAMTVSPLGLPGGWGAFEDFYRQYFPRVRMLVSRHFPACDAEEIAQETMTRCYTNYEELDRARDPWPWVSSVARNAAIDSMRRTSRVVTTDELPEPAGAAIDTTYDAVVVGERCRSVRRALSRLRPADRQLIEDRELEGLELTEMAAIRDITPNALRQQLFRARRSLAVELRRVGASLGVVPVAVQARLARWSRRANDFSAGTGAAGASALSVAATAAAAGAAGLAMMLGGPAEPGVTSAVRGAGEPIAAVERGAARSISTATTANHDRAAGPQRDAGEPAPTARAPYGTKPEIPVVIDRTGDPTKPGEPQSYVVLVETPVGPVGYQGEIGWVPGYGVLCHYGVTDCPERPREEPQG